MRNPVENLETQAWSLPGPPGLANSARILEHLRQLSEPVADLPELIVRKGWFLFVLLQLLFDFFDLFLHVFGLQFFS